MDRRLYWLWLSRSFSPGSAVVGTLLERFGDAEQIYRADEEALRSAGFRQTVIDRLRDRSLNEPERILNRVISAGDSLVTPDDTIYPMGLRQLSDRPAVLYCRGDMPDAELFPFLGMVGTRNATTAGCDEIYEIAAQLAAAGMTIVSGGARGIDTAALAGSLAGRGKAVVVMACPLDREYPAENKLLRRQIVEQGGALISEYPHGEPYRCLFPVRNRLIAGMSLGVCLGETPSHSGARITARLAREYQRDVFALPGAVAAHRYDGGHEEIRNGAILVTCSSDILHHYGLTLPEPVPPSSAGEDSHLQGRPSFGKGIFDGAGQSAQGEMLPSPAVLLPESCSPAAKKIASLLSGDPTAADELAAKASLSVAAVLSALTELELYGVAENTVGQQYRRC